MKKPYSYYIWPATILGFFAVIVGVNMLIVYNAYSGRPDAVVKDPYQEELKYQEIIDMLSNAKKSQLKLDLKTTKLSGKDHRYLVSIEVSPFENLPETLDLTLKRLDTDELDHTISVKTQSPGKYFKEVGLKKGLWEYQAKLKYKGDALLFQNKVFVD